MQGFQTQHPDRERLTAFGLGRLDEEESGQIELHLSDCQDCRKHLEDLPSDSLVQLLQASASDTLSHSTPVDPTSDVKSDPAAPAKKEPVPPLYGKLAQILTGKDKGQPPVAPATRTAGFSAPRELEGHSRYAVLEPLGAGGMGTVYKAQHRLMGRFVAIKIVNPILVTEPGAVDRFEREVKAAAQLVHPNIVTAYDAEKVGDLHLLVMEYVEGRTLAQTLHEKRVLPVGTACEYVRQTAVGLQYALERGMVHRDIKPQNLMLTSKGEIKILDFGLARFVSEQTPAEEPNEPGAPMRGSAGRSTQHGTLMGSPDYMAPEQAVDAHSADARADIYGMGCTLYHLLADQVPFPSSTVVEKLTAHRDQQPIPLHHIRPDVPVALANVVGKMMAKDPAQRYQTPAEVAAALAPFVQSPSVPRIAAAKPQNRRRVPWLAAAALLLILGPLGYFFGPAIYRFSTNQGVVIVETEDDQVEVVAKKNGEVVTIIDKKSGQQATLRAGKYEVELGKGKETLKLTTNDFALSRGGKEVVRVWREVAQVARPPVDMTVKDPPEKKKLAMPAELAFPFSAEDGEKRQQQWADYLQRRVIETNSVGMKLALIPPGEYPVTPEFRARLTKPFFLGIHEVTVGQFRRFVKEIRYRTDAEASGVGGYHLDPKTFLPTDPKPEYIWISRDFSPTDEHPVVFVSWNDADRFCTWLSKKEKKNYRLPTSAEWEWACRAGAIREPKTMPAVGWFVENSGNISHPVGKLPANAWGLFDMFGNAQEYCQDWVGPDPQGLVIDPIGPREGQFRVGRGGHWAAPPPPHYWYHGNYAPSLANSHSGFRVVCEVSPTDLKERPQPEESKGSGVNDARNKGPAP